tara:strand:- start:27614 stop:28861 length:1248 start_codon:yes stop_codon:yes gene_type:complete
MGSQFPVKTGIAHIVDTDVANSIDFHIAASSYTNTLDKYLGEIALVYFHNYTKHTWDTLETQSKFFEKLNDGINFNWGEDAGGYMDPYEANSADNLTYNKEDEPIDSLVNKLLAYSITNPGALSLPYVSYENTLLNETEVWVRNDDGSIQTEEGQFKAIDLVTMSNRLIKVDKPTNDAVRKHISAGNVPNIGMADLDNQFLIYWIEKFQRAHPEVHRKYQNLVTDSTVDYFTDFSDSIGSLVRDIDETVDPWMLPLFDVDFTGWSTDEKLRPSYLTPVLQDKIDDATEEQLHDMTSKIEKVYRKNIVHSSLIRAVAGINTAHGEDFNGGTGDTAQWKRMKTYTAQFNDIIAETLGNIYSVLLPWRNKIDNKQKIDYTVFDYVVENTSYEVDILRNKFKEVDSTVADIETALGSSR